MPDYQILLLPNADRWAWIEAAKPYAARFDVHLTSDPDEAARFMTPLQTISVAAVSGGYPAQGDIQAWFRANYPRLRLDVLPARTCSLPLTTRKRGSAANPHHETQTRNAGCHLCRLVDR